MIDQVQQQEQQPEQPDHQAERFKNRKAAWDWLQAQGHKVSRGKFYGDCDKGLLRVAKDGSISKFVVAMYGQGLDRSSQPEESVLNKNENESRRSKAEAEMAEIKAERMRREEDVLWLHADEAWAAVAGLVGRLRDAIRHQLHMAQVEVVHVAGGEQDRGPELFECLEGVIDKAFNEVAGEQIEIEFAKPTTEGGA